MRILIINDHLIASGGTETFVHALKTNLEKRGHKVMLFGSLEGETLLSIFSRWYSLKWYIKTIQKIKEFKPEVVHVNNCVRVISPSVINASAKMNIPRILTFHDFHYLCPREGGIYEKNRPKKYKSRHKCFFKDCFGYREKYKDFPRNYLWKFPKMILHRKIIKSKKISFVAPSQYFAKWIGKSLKRKISVINNGIDLPKKKTKYEKKIIFVGEINKEKGLGSIAKILNKVKKYKIFVLGGGDLKKHLEEKYENIKFLGFQKPEKYYRKASVALIPSIWKENFSYSVLEAMSYGLCLIASDVGGIPEQIEHMKTGLLFKRGDEKDFEEKLNYLIKNPKEIRRMGKNAREFAKKNYNWDKIINKYEAVYKKAIVSLKQK